MKARLSFLLLFYSFLLMGQTGKIQMTYDIGGNQITRTYIQVFRQSNTKDKTLKEITENDFLKSDIYEDIKYYPNPVKEELHIRWSVVDQDAITKLSVYSISGQYIKEIKNLEKEKSVAVSFSDVPVGYYNLVLEYNSGKQKTLKIVKI